MYTVSVQLTVILISMVVSEFRERMAVSKQGAQKFHWERLNLRKQNEVKVRKQYQIEIKNRFGALVN